MKHRNSVDIKNATDNNPGAEKIKHPTFLKNAISYGSEYADYSGLHGVRYLGEPKRNIWEKLWWLTVLIISLVFCVFTISETYSKLINSAIIISLAQKQTFVWHIPFPAVTICPENKCRKNIYNLAENVHKVRNESIDIPYDELKQFYDIALVCTTPNIPDRLDNYTVDSETYKFIEEVAPQVGETVVYCEGLNENGTCHEFFTTVITDLGVCFTFNMLDKKDIYKDEVDISETMMVSRTWKGWTLDKGYLEDDTRFTYPIRAVPGEEGALRFMLLDDRGLQDHMCVGPSEGFQVYLHNPGEVPFLTASYVRAPFNEEMVIVVKPDMTVTSDDLEDYDAKDRNCYYSTERELQYHKNYTQKNCELECLTNFTLNMCGCVSYYMPHNTSTEVCGYGKVNCTMEAKRELLEFQIRADLSKESKGLKFGKCNCMPGCTHIGYDTETSQTMLNLEEFFADAGVERDKNVTLTRISIKFKEQQFVATERKENYNWADFMSDCGGSLGLFIGFSFLSIFETVYFFSLRICCNVRRYGKHYWSGSSELLDEVGKSEPEVNKTEDDIEEPAYEGSGDIKLKKAIFHINERH